MRKENKINATLLISIIGIVLGFNSCLFNKKSYTTEKEFKNDVRLSHDDYSSDSLKLAHFFRQMIILHISPYHSEKFDDKTTIFIDTIIYSPDKMGASVFVITRCYNGSMKVSYGIDRNDYHFNGTIHFAVVNSDFDGNSEWKVSEHHGVRYILAEDYKKMSSILRADGFNNRSGIVNDSIRIEYNLDDIRIWDSKEFVHYRNSEFVCLSSE